MLIIIYFKWSTRLLQTYTFVDLKWPFTTTVEFANGESTQVWCWTKLYFWNHHAYKAVRFAFIWPQMPFDLHSNLIIPINTKYQVNFSLSLSLLHTKCEFYSSCTNSSYGVYSLQTHTNIIHTHHQSPTPITMARNTKTSLEVWKPFKKTPLCVCGNSKAVPQSFKPQKLAMHCC